MIFEVSETSKQFEVKKSEASQPHTPRKPHPFCHSCCLLRAIFFIFSAFCSFVFVFVFIQSRCLHVERIVFCLISLWMQCNHTFVLIVNAKSTQFVRVVSSRKTIYYHPCWMPLVWIVLLQSNLTYNLITPMKHLSLFPFLLRKQLFLHQSNASNNAFNSGQEIQNDANIPRSLSNSG